MNIIRTFFVFSFCLVFAKALPFNEASECPSLRKVVNVGPDTPVKCPQVCAKDLDCNEDKKCMCVKECGFVCVNANITCPLPAAPVHGYITGQKYTVGSKIQFMCNSGYFRKGYPHIVICRVDGSWTESNISCIARSCGDPGTPFNGKRNGMRFQYHDTVSFTCNKDYYLQGPAARTCQANQTWTGSQPLCKPLSCGNPPSVPQAKIFIYGDGGYVYGNQIEYECQPGYYREGDNRVYCGNDGKWHGSPPVCKEVRCPQPKALPHRNIQMNNNTEGGVVRYTCNHGYKLFGPHWRKCLKSGRWTGPEPICFECAVVGTPVFVRKPTHFKHGVVKFKSGNQVTVYYEAEDDEEDVIIIGRGTQHYIIVEDRIPSKKEIFIGSHVIAVNSRSHKYMFATVRVINGDLYGVQFDVNKFGRKEVPLNEIRTLEPPRFCTTCSDPGRPTFSSREDDLTEYIPECPSLQKVVNVGPDTPVKCPQVCAKDLDCNEDKKCMCVKECGFVCVNANITCPLPTTPVHGYITGQQYTVGSKIQFICNSGYFRKGYPHIAICHVDGSWTETNISCIARSCGDPGTPFNGKRNGMRFQYHDTVSFTCNKDYYLQGPATRTCQANQTWTDSQPLCKPLSCENPPSVPQAKIFIYGDGGYVYGNQIEYECQPGYYREGDERVYCGNDGKWHGSPPVCKEVRCPQPKALPHRNIQMNKNTEGGVVRYTCNHGYKLFGPHWRKCLKSGKWTGPEPICFECAVVGTPVFVRKPTHFKHGVVKFKSGNQVTVYYAAEDDEEDVIIIGRGTQHYIIVEDRIPSKKEIFIGSHVLAVNSRSHKYMFATVRAINGDLYGVQFDVNKFGRKEVPLNEIRTLEPPRFCTTCSDPGRPTFSSREDDLTEFIPGMEVIFTCQYTYKMTGSMTRQCQRDGTWTGTTPKCTVNSCDDLDAFPPRNGKRIGRNFTIGSTLEFSCNDGYSLIGQPRLTCTINGSWSYPPPTCTGVCENFQCKSAGEKCQYVKNVGPRCVCRENEDCRAFYEPVCGSDGLSYNSHCIMSATACRNGKEIRMVDQGRCLPGALCQIVPYSVCRGYFPRFFYNSTNNKCQYFIAGGCHPSGWNGFDTEQQCNQTCLDDICEQPINPGPCTQMVSHWAFDSTTGRCKKFNYGGCFGNENNFLTKGLCRKRCKQNKKISKGSCPNCVRVKLRQACKESSLAILARVISVLPNDEDKHLQRFHLEIHYVIKGSSRNVTQGKTIVSIPYQSSSIKCTCLRLPMNKKFVLIGRLTDEPANPKTGLILSPQSFANGWSIKMRKQIQLKCAGQLTIPKDIL